MQVIANASWLLHLSAYCWHEWQLSDLALLLPCGSSYAAQMQAAQESQRTGHPPPQSSPVSFLQKACGERWHLRHLQSPGHPQAHDDTDLKQLQTCWSQ